MLAQARSVATRVSNSRIGNAGSSSRLSALAVAQRRQLTTQLMGIDHRDRRPAMAAGGGVGQADRGATIDAVDLLDAGPDFVDLGEGEFPHEVLLAQEVIGRDEAAVTGGATAVREPRRALLIVHLVQRLPAARARRTVLHRPGGPQGDALE